MHVCNLMKNMEQTGKWKSNTNIQLEDKDKKRSVYQPQDSESHCDHMDDDPSDNTNSLAPRPGVKRKREAQLHKLSEKRRRHKINKKLRALQELIPNCTKMDKASVLDDAIEYLKSLQYQLRIMSIFAGLQTQMMLPTFYTPSLQCFASPFLGYGTRLQNAPPIMSRSTQ